MRAPKDACPCLSCCCSSLCASRQDCYGRDSLTQIIISSSVLLFFVLELGTRFVANGFWASLRQYWTVFDTVVVLVSFFLQAFKVLSDFLIIGTVDSRRLPLRLRASSPTDST
jgi:hypothetical protein